MCSWRRSLVKQKNCLETASILPPPCCHLSSSWKLTRVAFLDPTLALCTRSFLSPNCMPLSPAIAYTDTNDYSYSPDKQTTDVHFPLRGSFTWSFKLTSTYSQKAYPLDSPVALSFTRLKAFRGPNDVNSSFTWKTVLEIKYIKDITLSPHVSIIFD